jgi:hypothetical protein
MWEEYADKGTGFVIGFDTTHPGFELLQTPGRVLWARSPTVMSRLALSGLFLRTIALV